MKGREREQKTPIQRKTVEIKKNMGLGFLDNKCKKEVELGSALKR